MWDKNLIRIWEFFVPLNYELQLKRISVKGVYRSQKKKKLFCAIELWASVKENKCQRSLPFAKKKKLFLEDFFKFVFKIH